MSAQSDDFKACLSRFASGVTIVTYSHENNFGGITVSSFSSLSLDPPLVLFCIQKTTPSHEKIKSSGAFCVNILSSEQENLSNSFAKHDLNKHDLIVKNGFSEKVTKSPILKDTLAFLDCEVENFFDGGDHSIIVGKVLDLGSSPDKRPLLYYNKKYHSI